jgi:CubicO group peptidase (beta-lactamase class C family)
MIALILLSSRLVMAEEISPDALKQFLRDNIDLDKHRIGIVIGFVDEHGTQIVSYGKLDNGTDADVNADTVFEIGSISKTFTVLLLEDMVARGEMKLDDPVAKYLPESVKVPSRNGEQITLLDLATHMSGLPRNPDNLAPTSGLNPFMDYSNPFRDYTQEKLYTFLSKHNLRRDPGAEFEYSNLGMGLLGHAIALKAGTDYESLLVGRICDPLKMPSTRVTLSPEMMARLARGHNNKGKLVANWDLGVLVGCGGIRSTANDLLKYVAANVGLTTSPLKPLMLDMQVIRHHNAFDPTGTTRGNTAMPWMDTGVFQPPGMDLLGHGGGTGGYSTFIGFDKKQRRGIVVLSNQLMFSCSELGFRLLQKLPLDGVTLATIQAQREVTGIGVALGSDEKTHALRITKVLPNSPASQAGLVAGSIIQKIDDVSTNGKSLADCVALIRGPVGSKVRLELLEPEHEQASTVEIVRQKFQTTS